MYFKVAKTADGAACAIEFEGIHVLRIVEGAERNEQFAQDVSDALNELLVYTEPYVTGAIMSMLEKTNQLKSATTTVPERGSMSTKPTTTKQPKGKAKPKQKTKDDRKQSGLEGKSKQTITVNTLKGRRTISFTLPPVNIDRLLADFKRLTPEQKSKVMTKLTRGLA